MAEFLRNEKGIAYLKITWLDLVKYSENISPVCDECLTSLIGNNDVMLIPILNEAYCPKCGAKVLDRLNKYPEDVAIEESREQFWLKYFNIKEAPVSKEEKIRVVIIEPFEQPRIAMIGKDLESIQAIVDGYIEVISANQAFFGRVFKDYLIVLNEEGKLRGLPMNLQIRNDFIVGTVFICKKDGEELAGLTEDEAKTLAGLLRRV